MLVQIGRVCVAVQSTICSDDQLRRRRQMASAAPASMTPSTSQTSQLPPKDGSGTALIGRRTGSLAESGWMGRSRMAVAAVVGDGTVKTVVGGGAVKEPLPADRVGLEVAVGDEAAPGRIV